MTNLKNVFIVDGARTPQLKVRTGPGDFHASDLAHDAARFLFKKLKLSPTTIDELILGCASPGPNEANIARVVSLRLGCGEKTPAWTVHRNCASGMQSIDNAMQSIQLGRSELVLAGGTEAMSHHPVLLNNLMVAWLAAWSQARTMSARGKILLQLRAQHLVPVIGILRGLTDPTVGISMGQTAEELAYRFSITRSMMDAYAVRSHQRLAIAQENNKLEEIVPLYGKNGQIYTADDGLRADSSEDKLAKLRPVFDRVAGAVTAGNSAQITDGAAMLLLASEDAVNKYKLPVLGRIVDNQWAGLSPEQMGLGPVHAMAPIMERQGLDSNDIDNWEINEAFAAQILACLSAWKDTDFCREELSQESAFTPIDETKLNIDGGGISLGHPIGASGARIILHCLNNLKDNGGRLGMTSLCIGGGQGGAFLLERSQT